MLRSLTERGGRSGGKTNVYLVTGGWKPKATHRRNQPTFGPRSKGGGVTTRLDLLFYTKQGLFYPFDAFSRRAYNEPVFCAFLYAM